MLFSEMVARVPAPSMKLGIEQSSGHAMDAH